MSAWSLGLPSEVDNLGLCFSEYLGLPEPDLGLRDIVVRGLPERGLMDFGLLDFGLRKAVGLADLVSACFLALNSRELSAMRHGLLLARVRLRVRVRACGTVFQGLGLIGGEVLVYFVFILALFVLVVLVSLVLLLFALTLLFALELSLLALLTQLLNVGEEWARALGSK